MCEEALEGWEVMSSNPHSGGGGGLNQAVDWAITKEELLVPA